MVKFLIMKFIFESVKLKYRINIKFDFKLDIKILKY